MLQGTAWLQSNTTQVPGMSELDHLKAGVLSISSSLSWSLKLDGSVSFIFADGGIVILMVGWIVTDTLLVLFDD